MSERCRENEWETTDGTGISDDDDYDDGLRRTGTEGNNEKNTNHNAHEKTRYAADRQTVTRCSQQIALTLAVRRPAGRPVGCHQM